MDQFAIAAWVQAQRGGSAEDAWATAGELMAKYADAREIFVSASAADIGLTAG